MGILVLVSMYHVYTVFCIYHVYHVYTEPKGIRIYESGILDGCDLPLGTENQTWVLYKSRSALKH